MKDNFSANAAQYARYRPGYPPELFKYLLNLIPEKNLAWDCATGNGQVAGELAKYFKNVAATDISLQQLQHAVQASNISYTRQSAEKTAFPDNYFDLLTVGQAVHWFNFNDFYKEAKRTLLPGGLIAIIGYGLFKSNSKTNRVINHFYEEIIGPYWDPERKYLDEGYVTIPFPFNEISAPEFITSYKWTIDRLIGYLKTWSAVKHFENANQYDPVAKIEKELREAFGELGEIQFPILLRVGRNEK